MRKARARRKSLRQRLPWWLDLNYDAVDFSCFAVAFFALATEVKVLFFLMSEKKTTIMYAGKLESGRLFHFYPHPKLITNVCGCKEAFRVRVTEGENPDGYWGWWDAKGQKFTMVYPNEALLGICFPYGMKAAENAGDGKGYPVEIEVLE
jgi:hypothetical protein